MFFQSCILLVQKLLFPFFILLFATKFITQDQVNNEGSGDDAVNLVMRVPIVLNCSVKDIGVESIQNHRSPFLTFQNTSDSYQRYQHVTTNLSYLIEMQICIIHIQISACCTRSHYRYYRTCAKIFQIRDYFSLSLWRKLKVAFLFCECANICICKNIFSFPAIKKDG